MVQCADQKQAETEIIDADAVFGTVSPGLLGKAMKLRWIRQKMDTEKFAFPKERKEPLNDASHVRNAVARFDQVEGVSNEERDAAWRRIRAAARRHDVQIEERGWRQLFKKNGREVPTG